MCTPAHQVLGSLLCWLRLSQLLRPLIYVPQRNGGGNGDLLLCSAPPTLYIALPLALHDAAASGHMRFVRRLLEQAADPKQWPDQMCSPLFAAARNGHLRVVRALVQAGDMTMQCCGETGPKVLRLDFGFAHLTASYLAASYFLLFFYSANPAACECV